MMTQQLLDTLQELLKENNNSIQFSGFEINRVGIKEVTPKFIEIENIITGENYQLNHIQFTKYIGSHGLFKLVDYIRTITPTYVGEKNNMKAPYNYLIHYNEYTGKFACIHRDDIKYYFGAGERVDEFDLRVGYGDTLIESIKEASIHFNNEIECE